MKKSLRKGPVDDSESRRGMGRVKGSKTHTDGLYGDTEINNQRMRSSSFIQDVSDNLKIEDLVPSTNYLKNLFTYLQTRRKQTCTR